MGKKRTNAFAKRQRERAKQEKKREKAEKMAQRRADKENGSDGLLQDVDPDIAGIVPGPQPLPEEALDPELLAAARAEDEDDDDEDDERG